MPDQPTIEQLVERFYNDEQRRSPTYNETEARIQYINPLFRALGWDVDNIRGRGEVRHEDTVTIGGKAKAPDYGFYLDNRRRFFVEAKKPAVNLDQDVAPAYQLRRYGWTAKLPLSILTDFQEFAVYDTRVRPHAGDNPKVARTRYWTYKEYPDVWDEIAAVFSREAVLSGSLEQYAAEQGGKKGVATVDAEFLREIERWRELLARNIALRNPGLDERGLNFAVQQTIDRLLFLRIAEDRGIEPYGRLQGLLKGGDLYSRLFAFFNQADARYNSGLFHFAPERGRGDPDLLTPRLNIDDKALKEIIGNLYAPASPYEFSVFPADILGQVYEQFLGKVIRLTGKSAKVEEKPEVRKAGGVYYTPTYIVEYIVRQTVGKLVEGHTPDPTGPVSRVRVLDPACGSGSFLLGAYAYLLDWHLRGYLTDAGKWSKGRNKTLHRTAAGEYHLTLAERKRILLDNLYGVDIDPQAVEVTKLSLLLKALEETPDALSGQLALLPERVLPDLDNNIKCGNSLIGPDFYAQGQLALFDREEQLRINAFDWQAEFRDVMSVGGFDAVIGNPPYIRIQTMKEWAPVEVEHYKQAYRAAGKGNYDIYVVFVEKGLSLLNPRGRLGFILPHKFFNAKYGEPLRGVIAEGRHLDEIIHFGAEQVFSSATTYTCLLFLSKSPQDQFHIAKAHDLSAWQRGNDISNGYIQSELVNEKEWNFSIGKGTELIERVRAVPHTLGEIATIFVGLQTSADRVFTMRDFKDLESDLLRPLLKTDALRPYDFPQVYSWILFPYYVENDQADLIPANEMKRKYPNAWAYLKSNEPLLRARDNGQWNHDRWYAFGRSQNLAQMDGEKLIIQVMALKPTIIHDERSLYMTGGGSGPFYGIRLKDQSMSLHYLMGILNSRLFGYIIEAQSTVMRGGYIKYSKQYIESAPIRTIDFDNPTDVARHDRMVALVQNMLDLHKELAAERNPQVKTVLQRQIEATDAQIDRLVYELYGLSEEEIAIVEGHS
ncbi:MAG: Eco57I restriction-modification methylase domain-containing protein [Candidatus Promineofilum sp.]|nr:Eco57I restriction-modification methylase domain-containing protein [Promineifilum sp.]